ncbi:MAG: hypothetical protein JOZ52_06785, partial [Acidobacteria bacterium]|nr:hypothetical protein [Acidobacteriota bacterium]
MVKRIIAIAFIFVCATIAWVILGATIFQRTYDSDSASAGRVASTWGAPHNQSPPVATYVVAPPKPAAVKVVGNGVGTGGGLANNQTVVASAQPETVTETLPLESSRIDVALDLEHRQKGLLWYSTYKVSFAGVYAFRNPSDKEQEVKFTLSYPTAQAIYDDLVFTVDDAQMTLENEPNSVSGKMRLAAGKTVTLKVGYRSQGLDSWRYNFGQNVSQVRDFTLRMKTNFKEVDFPENTLSPTEKRETADGWELSWSYKNLLSGYQIAMTMPEKLQPGPLAGRISFFAPVSL